MKLKLTTWIFVSCVMLHTDAQFCGNENIYIEGVDTGSTYEQCIVDRGQKYTNVTYDPNSRMFSFVSTTTMQTGNSRCYMEENSVVSEQSMIESLNTGLLRQTYRFLQLPVLKVKSFKNYGEDFAIRCDNEINEKYTFSVDVGGITKDEFLELARKMWYNFFTLRWGVHDGCIIPQYNISQYSQYNKQQLFSVGVVYNCSCPLFEGGHPHREELRCPDMWTLHQDPTDHIRCELGKCYTGMPCLSDTCAINHIGKNCVACASGKYSLKTGVLSKEATECIPRPKTSSLCAAFIDFKLDSCNISTVGYERQLADRIIDIECVADNVIRMTHDNFDNYDADVTRGEILRVLGRIGNEDNLQIERCCKTNIGGDPLCVACDFSTKVGNRRLLTENVADVDTSVNTYMMSWTATPVTKNNTLEIVAYVTAAILALFAFILFAFTPYMRTLIIHKTKTTETRAGDGSGSYQPVP